MIKSTIYERIVVRDANNNILGCLVRTEPHSIYTLAQRARAVMQDHLDQKAAEGKSV